MVYFYEEVFCKTCTKEIIVTKRMELGGNYNGAYQYQPQKTNIYNKSILNYKKSIT